MKRSMLWLLAAAMPAVFSWRCTKNEIVVQPEPAGEQFRVRADQYAMNHYFVDTSYIPLYEMFYGNEPPMVYSASRIVETEVWMQIQGTSVDTTDKYAMAWIALPPRQAGGYDSTFTSTPEVPGTAEFLRCRRLDPSMYTIEGSGYIGVLSFKGMEPFPDVAFGIAYRQADGTQFGDFLRNRNSNTTNNPLVLKMVKPRNLFTTGPIYGVAWQMLLKNIYSIHHGHISRHEFQLDILRTNPGRKDESVILGHPLLRILGLDRFADDGTYRPDGDGMFDFRPGRTISNDEGEIIFPYLRPFDTGIKRYFQNRGLPPPGPEFLFPEVYDTLSFFARESGRNRYVISGSGIFD